MTTRLEVETKLDELGDVLAEMEMEKSGELGIVLAEYKVAGCEAVEMAALVLVDLCALARDGEKVHVEIVQVLADLREAAVVAGYTKKR